MYIYVYMYVYVYICINGYLPLEQEEGERLLLGLNRRHMHVCIFTKYIRIHMSMYECICVGVYTV